MKNILLLALFSGFQLIAFAQKRLVKDIDGDGKKDSIYIDKEFSIVCRLSSQNFIKLKSKPMEISTDNRYIQSKPNGFEISIIVCDLVILASSDMRKGRKELGQLA